MLSYSKKLVYLLDNYLLMGVPFIYLQSSVFKFGFFSLPLP
jgi:hypothetical protein